MKIIKVCLFLIKSNSGGNPCSQVIVISNLAQSNHRLPQIMDYFDLLPCGYILTEETRGGEVLEMSGSFVGT